MNNQDFTELIEAYLNGTLPAEERREVERRMETDKAFRREVRLHRQLREHLSDPERWKHYSALEQAKKAPLPPDDKPASYRTRYWKWVGLLALVLLAGVFVWQLSKPAAGLVSPPPTEKEPTESPASPQLEESKEAPQESAPAEQKPKKDEPIAEADPANFIPNPSMEAFVRSGMKSENLEIKISTPVNGTDFTLDSKGEALVRFSGTIKDVSEDVPGALVLAVFNNKEANKPLISLPLKLTKGPAGNLTFDILQNLKYQPGLYYFFIEQQKGEMVYAGKFTIGKGK